MSIFTDYLKRGMIVIPQREYRPLVKWSKFYTERPSESDIAYFEKFFPDTVEYVLVCGKPSGVIALDIDVNEPEKIERLRKLFKPACEKFGTKGITFFFKYNGEESDNYGDIDGHPIVELKSDGSLVTIPPSKLPKKKQSANEKTKYYTWTTEELLKVELTTLPADYAETIRSVFSIIEKEPEYVTEYIPTTYDNRRTSEEEVVSALEYLSSDIPYKEWALVGGCIYQEFQMAGFYIFDDWSARAGKRYNRKASYIQYQNGVKYKKCGIGAIFKKAIAVGWINPYHSEIEIVETRVIDLKDWTKRKLEKKATQEIDKSETESQLIQNAPPLIKGLVEWICSTAMYSQPMLSLGAVVTTLGFIMGRKYQLDGKRTNIYSVCLAGSQQGKEHVKEAVQKILKAAKMEEHYERTWSSGAAIESALDAKKGEVLYCTEEMAILMRGMTGKFADKNQNDAQAAITELSTTNYYVGKGYALRKERPTLKLNYPNCAIVGFAQPEVFFESLSSAEALTGFLNRLFIFQAPKLRPNHNENRNYSEFEIMPPKLKHGIEKIVQNYADFLHQKGGLRVDNLPLKPVKYDEETKFYKLSLMREIDKKFREYQESGDRLELIVGRAVESMERLAIIASLGADEITIKEFKWAQSVVEYCLGLMCQASGDLIGDSEFERDCNKIIKYIKENELVTTSQLLTRFRKYKAKELEDTLITLTRAGSIQAINIKGATKTVTHYKIGEVASTSTHKFSLNGQSMQGGF